MTDPSASVQNESDQFIVAVATATRKGASVERLFYRAEEASAILGIGRTKLFDLIRRGQIRACKIDGATRLHAAEIRSFAEKLKAEASLEPVA